MSTFLPESSRDGSATGLAGLETIQAALRKKTVSRELNWAKKTKAILTREQEERLDELKEIMLSFQTDRELLAWSMQAVFDFPPTKTGEGTLFPDPRKAINSHNSLNSASYATTVDPSAMPRGPFSPIYSELLLALFLLLRDTHLQPNSALHVFALASITPHSYVLGCTTALYNEVLRTRWMEGDVISVAVALEEMRSGGVRIDGGTRAIVAAVGEAIRNDGRRADERAKAELPSPLSSISSLSLSSSRSSWPAFDETSSSVSRFSDSQINAFRFFSTRQIAAWGKMERIVEENQDERAQAKVDKEDEAREEWEMRKAGNHPREVDQYSRDGEEEYREEEERPRGLSSRRREPPLRDEQPLSPAAPTPSLMRDTIRLEEYHDETEDAHDEAGIDKSWANFPSFPSRTDESQREREESAVQRRTDLFGRSARMEGGQTNSSAFSERGSAGRFAEQAPDQSAASFFDGAMHSLSRSDGRDESADRRNSEFEDGRNAEFDSRRDAFDDNRRETEYENDSRYETPEPRKFREKEPRFEDGGILPKRPSSLNPFKIRRKGLTKLEKARFDNPHPLLFWKQKK